MSDIYDDQGAPLDQFQEVTLRPTGANNITIRVEMTGPRFAPVKQCTIRWTSDDGTPIRIMVRGEIDVQIGETPPP